MKNVEFKQRHLLTLLRKIYLLLLVVEHMQNIKMITKLSDYLGEAKTMPATKAVTRKAPIPVYTAVQLSAVRTNTCMCITVGEIK